MSGGRRTEQRRNERCKENGTASQRAAGGERNIIAMHGGEGNGTASQRAVGGERNSVAMHGGEGNGTASQRAAR